MIFMSISVICNFPAYNQAQDTSETYTNPVLEQSGDPGVFRYGNLFYLYLPNNTVKPGRYDVFKSRGLVKWESAGVAFTDPRAKQLWAPNVYHHSDGLFYLYYTAVRGKPRDKRIGNRDIGVAVSDKPEGPFESVKILLDNDFAFIDPHLFRDDDEKLYLVYKERGAFGTGSSIRAVKMRSPLEMEPNSAATLIKAGSNKTWERQVAEQPFLHKQGETYVLFYSGASGADESYAIGIATSISPLGPYRKSPKNPVVQSQNSTGVIAPGAVLIVTDGSGEHWMIYRQKRDKNRNGDRFVAIDRIMIDPDGNVRIEATHNAARPAPIQLK